MMKVKKYSLLDNIRYVIGFCWYNDGVLFSVCLFYTVFAGVMPFVGVLLPKYLIDELTGARRPIVFVMILTIAGIVALICRLGLDRVSCSQWRRVVRIRCKLMDLRGKKVMTMNFVNTEDPEILTKFEKSYIATGENISVDMRGVEAIIKNLIYLPSYILSFLGYVYIISLLNPLILILLIGGVAVSYLLNLKIRKFEHKLMDERGQYIRKRRYFDEKFLDFKLAKDIRLFRLDRLMMRKFKEAGYANLSLTREYYRKYFLIILASLIIDFVREGLVYGYLAYNVITKGMGIGDFSMYTLAIASFSGALNKIMEAIADIVHRDLYIKDFRMFLDIPEDETLPLYDSIHKAANYEIEFKNVFFKYPGGNNYIFEDFSMKIEGGKRLAIVGLNGAGKTTLVKLMTRLYEPEKGSILINGIDIRSYSNKSVYKIFSVVFQEVNLYAFTVAENVSMHTAEEMNRNLAVECLKKVGLDDKIQSIEKGIDHNLLKVLDSEGAELSGGQSQKLALARAIYKNGDILVLDEPTAALDPIAEYKVYKSFDELIGKKTAVYISHRLSSTRFCDKIVLIENGKIMEQGTHYELMGINGKYAEMFDKQSYYYKDSEVVI